MSQSDPKYLLIARSIATDHQGLAELRPLLARKFGLDGYMLQQRLIGRGCNCIADGNKERLTDIAALLAEQNIRCWIVAAKAPRFAPLKLRSVRLGDEQLSLITNEQVVNLTAEHRILAVLADLSGQAAAKNLKFHMAQRVYNGVRETRPLGDAELAKATLRGKPILDVYRFDDQGEVDAAVRILPGRFDPRGLGDLATLSAVGNLRIILQQIRRQVASCQLQLDFGLANLPGCRLKNAEDGLNWQRDNLAALTRFGWLMTQLRANGPASATAGVATAAVAHPLLEMLRKELGEEAPAAGSPQPAPSVSLPPPPPPGTQHTASPQLTLGIAVAVGFGLLTATGSGMVFSTLRAGIRTAILPALLTGLSFWGALHFWRLKRHVENTPTSKARSLSMGLVELQGRARRKFALVSPLSQMPCIFYRLRKYRRDSKNNWRLSSSTDSGHVPFYLEDDTGRVTIDPRGASVTARHRQESLGGRSHTMFGSLGGNGSEKWIEEMVTEGTQLYILGQARENRHKGASLRARVTRALQELKRNPDVLQQYDRDGDGRICETEWEHARNSIEQQVLQESLAGDHTRVTQSERVIVGRPRQRSIPFVIAETESERHLVRNYTLLTLTLFIGSLGGLVWTLLTLMDFLQPQ